MRSSGSILITCLAVLILGPVLALANGLYMPTVGSRAGAMGGAFIGLADDYSAVYWNPAGITQIKGMEATVTGHDVVPLASREGYVRFDGYGGATDRFALAEIGVTNRTSNNIAPGFFFVTDAGPLRSVFDKVGVAAYTLSEYGVTWTGEDVLNNSSFIGHQHDFDYRFLVADMQDYESRLKTYVISPVLAKEVVPGLSIGVTANFAYSHLTLSNVFMDAYVDTIDTPDIEDDYALYITPVQLTDDVTGWGYGATVGMLYRASTNVSVGMVFRTPMTISYDGTYSLKVSGGGETYEYPHNSDFEVKFPMWAGGGFAYRDFIFDGLTMTGDVQWTAWSSVESIDRNVVWGGGWSEDDLAMLAGLETTEFNWEDTVEIGVGFEYRLGRSASLNLGYRNSPSPVADEHYDFLMPMSAKNVLAGGVTYRQDFWRASFTLEYHAGDERRLVGTDNMDGKHVEDLLVPSLSLTYAF